MAKQQENANARSADSARVRLGGKSSAHVPDSVVADLPPLLVVIALVAFVPGGLFPYVWAKLVLVAVALLFHAIRPVRRGHLPWIDIALLAAAVLWLVVAAFAGESPQPALVGRWPRYEGIPVIAMYVACVVAGAHILGGAGAERAWRWLLDGAAATSLAIGAIAGLEAVGFRPLGGSPEMRMGATLGNATELGLAAMMFTSMLLPVAVIRRKPLHIVGAGVAAITVGLSGSRAALGGLVIAVVVSILLARGRTPSVTRRGGYAPWIAGGAVVAALAGALIVPSIRDRLTSTSTITGRFVLWENALTLVRESPMTGVGPSGFVDALPLVLTRSAAIQLGSQTTHDSPHMWILQAAAAGGIVLVALALALALRLVYSGLTMMRADSVGPEVVGAFGAVAGYGVALLTHFTSPTTTPLVALLIGVLLARPAEGLRHTKGTSRIRVVAGSTAGLLALAALAGTCAEWPLRRATDSLAVGAVDDAERSFAFAVRLRPWDSDVALIAAQAMAKGATQGFPGSASGAVKWAGRALEANPHSEEAAVALAVGQMHSDDVLGAIATLDAIDRRAPAITQVHLQRGIAKFGLGDVQGALADLEEAAALDPRAPDAWVIIARIYERLGDATAAAAALREADERGFRELDS